MIAKWKKGEKITKSQVVIVKDVIPPEVTITLSPSAPNIKERVEFTATGTDQTGIVKIAILVNGTIVEECTGSPCTYIGGPYPPGNVSYEAHAWDKSDNKGVAGPKTLKIGDIMAPKVNISTGSWSFNPYYRAAIFTATATDPGGISKIEIYVLNKKVKECSDSPCKYEGSYPKDFHVVYFANAYDKAGNKASTGVGYYVIR